MTAQEFLLFRVKRVSKPGRRLYRSAREIIPVRYGHGALILSTPKGILTGKEARKENVGGEALLKYGKQNKEHSDYVLLIQHRFRKHTKICKTMELNRNQNL